MLTWNELDELGNLAKCAKISLSGETHLMVQISNNNSVWILLVLGKLISRELHYMMGVSEYNVLRV